MKITKRIAALALVILMVTAFVSCGGAAPDGNNSGSGTKSVTETTTAPEASIVGTWKYKLNIGDIMDMNDASDSETDEETDSLDKQLKPMLEKLYGAYKGVTVDLLLKFTDDDEFTLETDKNSVKKSLKKVKKKIVKLLPDIFSSLEYNLDEYMKYMDSSKEMLADELMGSIDEDSFSPESSSGTYHCEGNKLYMSEGDADKTSNYCVFELTNDTFTITDVVGTDSTFSDYKDVLLPMKFKRV